MQAASMSELKQRVPAHPGFRSPDRVGALSLTQDSRSSVGAGAIAVAAPTITFPDFKPARVRLGSTARRAGIRWSNRYRNLLLAADALVIAAVTAAAHITRFGLSTESSVGIGGLQVDYLYVSVFI